MGGPPMPKKPPATPDIVVQTAAEAGLAFRWIRLEKNIK